MLNHKNIVLNTLFVAILLYLNVAWPETDIPGSKDHPKLPRVEGTVIFGFAESSYDEGVFMTGASGKELLSENIEGERTRIMYVGAKDLSPLGVLRNYQSVFDDLGEVEVVYTCKGNDCFSNLGKEFAWRKSNRIPNNLGNNADYIASFGGFNDQVYWYGKVTTGESIYHISIYSAIITYAKAWGGYAVKQIQDHPVISLEVVEVTDFKPTLEVVTAADMTDKIRQTGRIALYGIHFDFDNDLLKPESDTALEEIAKALRADTRLDIYVVGHTDNKGTLDYNEDLSMRRARAVVNKLISNCSIGSDRMVPVGVGLAAPIATNKTEEGRSLNRRVELVER